MIILGIDPGFERLGIAILKKEHGSKEAVLFSECFITPKTSDFTERLVQIGNRIQELIDLYHPTHLGIETLFIENNQKTAMHVSEVRGTIIFLAARAGLRVCEYSPLQIKSAVTGYGKADKKAVMLMVPKLVALDMTQKRLDDELDAIAVAITTGASERF